MLSQTLSFPDAVQQATGGDGSDAVSAVVGAIFGFVGGVFGLFTILILAFYLLLDSRKLFRRFVALFPKSERERVEDASRRISSKVSAWLAGQLLLGGDHRHNRGHRSLAAGRAVLLCARADCRHGRDDPGRRTDPVGDPRCRRCVDGVASDGVIRRHLLSRSAARSRITCSCRRSWSGRSASAPAS